jgi:hypothetical protein
MSETAITPATLPPAPRRGRRRLAIGLIAAAVVSALGFAALKLFVTCSDCRPSPILCPDPCTLPTFGAVPDAVSGPVAA